MANDAHELESSELVGEGEETNDGGHVGDESHAGEAHPGDGQAMSVNQTVPPTPADAEALEKQRARRAAFKSVEGRVIALERRAEAVADEMGRVRDQVAQLDARLAKLEGRLEAGSPNADGAPADLAQVSEHLRQLDERLQKLANALAEQSWSVPDARMLK
jgi:ubiquinone biosynthesis protein UbiJ